ncbi:ATP-binding cassette domain-containing protein [Actinoplanes sp. KI2]|uniref:ABC transporter ATP-binding protein n=1 Tax=Actinoplanes sp. KI2 TaxID=2983315 RepID=UPI0021D5C9EF|nr:ATP-binding cassette domain-containing protein [Actinoplanes sp. KI2]MCU7730337.1 ATP-binding cassette domain-containing protein [Actinoplanes sp. KI2]
MIELRGLTKRYRDTTAVDDLTCTFRPGVVTGFLGPNGAGKTTTMLMTLGLQRPTAGSALLGGRRYRDLPVPMREAGALLDARAVHHARSGRNHLLALATSNGLPRRRVDEVLDLVGLTAVAGKAAGTYSLGMSQRLGIAGALLGDPPILLFDEPVNGLDPSGIAWARTLMRGLAAEGRTVVVSSHLMSEMEQTADHLVVIGKGRLIADTSLAEFLASQPAASQTAASQTAAGMVVRAADAGFAETLRGAGATVVAQDDGGLLVGGIDAYGVGKLALASGTVLTELSPRRSSLEEVFMAMTAESVEFSGGAR